MPHLINSIDVERLSRLTGVHNFKEWSDQLEGREARVQAQLASTIENAWNRCLPIWLSVGRVCDLSRGIHISKYWPSYGNSLGEAFAYRFKTEVAFLVALLHSSPVDSHEYLCLCDLLTKIACDPDSSETTQGILFAIDCPLPQVIQLEIEGVSRYEELSTVGELLCREFKINWTEEFD